MADAVTPVFGYAVGRSQRHRRLMPAAASVFGSPRHRLLTDAVTPVLGYAVGGSPRHHLLTAAAVPVFDDAVDRSARRRHAAAALRAGC